jgi:hypothetical protein
VCFTFERQEAVTGGLSVMRPVGHRDRFHFGTQVDVVSRADGTGLLRCTATGRDDARRLADLVVALLDAPVRS